MIGYPHRVNVKRKDVAKTNLSPGYADVFLGLECLVEPMGAFRKATLLGTVGGRRYHLSWASADLRDGDRIEWDGRKFRLEYDSDDRHRVGGIVPAYQTGILIEEVT